MRIRRTDGTVLAAGEIIPTAERLGLVAADRHTRGRAGRRRIAGGTGPQSEPQRLARLHHRSGLVGQLRRADAQPSRCRRADRDRDHRDGGVPATSMTRSASSPAPRISDAASRSTISAPATPRSATCASSASTSSRSTDPSCRTSRARRTTALFVRTMVELAKGLGLATVAEWVQDEQTAAILTEWGCDYLQGELVGLASLERPRPPRIPAPTPTVLRRPEACSPDEIRATVPGAMSSRIAQSLPSGAPAGAIRCASATAYASPFAPVSCSRRRCISPS